MNNLQHFLSHSTINVHFKPTKDDFVVTEVPLYELSNDGEHLFFTLRKKDLTTWEAIEYLAQYLKCNAREFGYAGLKDKNALTYQSISIHKNYEEQLSKFEHGKIKITILGYHNNKLKIGHLKGNKFFTRLKRVQPKDAYKLEQIRKKISQFGIPNYFGEQRFGIDGDNYKKAQELIQSGKKFKNTKLTKMWFNAYQSYLFNQWLSKRIEISKLFESFSYEQIKDLVGFEITKKEFENIKKQPHPFKIIDGDVFSHYPFGKIFYAENLEEESEKFSIKDRVPTGLLAGSKTKIAINDALKIEENFDKKTLQNGARRFAWIFPRDLIAHYKEEENWYELTFELPKGSYATEVIKELIH